ARLERVAEWADADLVQLARQCLAPSREDRPHDAATVARAEARYQQDLQQRLKQADIDRAAAQARAEEEQKRRLVEQARADEESKRRQAEQAQVREERRRRRIQLQLAAAVVLFLVAGGGVAVWYWGEQVRRDARYEYVRGEVGTALAEAD